MAKKPIYDIGKTIFSDKIRITDETSFMIGVSKIEGVGLFITHPVCKGMELHIVEDLDKGWRYIPREQAEANPQLMAMCMKHYGQEIDEMNGFWVDKDLRYMRLWCYVNHSDDPTAKLDEEYHWYATRDLKAGDEITLKYSDQQLKGGKK